MGEFHVTSQDQYQHIAGPQPVVGVDRSAQGGLELAAGPLEDLSAEQLQPWSFSDRRGRWHHGGRRHRIQINPEQANGVEHLGVGLSGLRGISAGEVGVEEVFRISRRLEAGADLIRRQSRAADAVAKLGSKVGPSLQQPLRLVGGGLLRLGSSWGTGEEERCNKQHELGTLSGQSEGHPARSPPVWGPSRILTPLVPYPADSYLARVPSLFDPTDPRPLHFLGISGAGMSALALAARRRGVAVTGCDVDPTAFADLERAGAVTHPGPDAAHLTGVRAVVVTAAAPQDHPELVAARAADIRVVPRKDALAELVNASTLVGIAGTHGKTTTTVMTTMALRQPGSTLPGSPVAGSRSGVATHCSMAMTSSWSRPTNTIRRS